MNFRHQSVSQFSFTHLTARRSSLTKKLSQEYLTDQELAHLKSDLLPTSRLHDAPPSPDTTSPSNESVRSAAVQLANGIASALNLTDEEMGLVLGANPDEGAAFYENFCTSASGIAKRDAEERVDILFEIIAAIKALTGATGKSELFPVVRSYLERMGGLERLRGGSVQDLLDLRYTLYSRVGGVLGRKDARESISSTEAIIE